MRVLLLGVLLSQVSAMMGRNSGSKGGPLFSTSRGNSHHHGSGDSSLAVEKEPKTFEEASKVEVAPERFRADPTSQELLLWGLVTKSGSSSRRVYSTELPKDEAYNTYRTKIGKISLKTDGSDEKVVVLECYALGQALFGTIQFAPTVFTSGFRSPTAPQIDRWCAQLGYQDNPYAGHAMEGGCEQLSAGWDQYKVTHCKDWVRLERTGWDFECRPFELKLAFTLGQKSRDSLASDLTSKKLPKVPCLKGDSQLEKDPSGLVVANKDDNGHVTCRYHGVTYIGDFAQFDIGTDEHNKSPTHYCMLIHQYLHLEKAEALRKVVFNWTPGSLIRGLGYGILTQDHVEEPEPVVKEVISDLPGSSVRKDDQSGCFRTVSNHNSFSVCSDRITVRHEENDGACDFSITTPIQLTEETKIEQLAKELEAHLLSTSIPCHLEAEKKNTILKDWSHKSFAAEATGEAPLQCRMVFFHPVTVPSSYSDIGTANTFCEYQYVFSYWFNQIAYRAGILSVPTN